MKFLIGFGIGFSLALLFAPAAGDETRRQIGRGARNLASTSGEALTSTAGRISETARDKAGEIGSTVGRQAAEAMVDSMIGTPQPRSA